MWEMALKLKLSVEWASSELVLYPDSPTEEIERGSGQKGCTSLSPRTKSCRANHIEERCHMTNGMLISFPLHAS